MQRPTTRTAVAITALAVIVLLTYGLALTGCSSSVAGSAANHTSVHVAAATSGPATPAILSNGVVANKDEMRLSFKVAGVIKSIHVEEGETVHAGERLAESSRLRSTRSSSRRARSPRRRSGISPVASGCTPTR